MIEAQVGSGTQRVARCVETDDRSADRGPHMGGTRIGRHENTGPLNHSQQLLEAGLAHQVQQLAAAGFLEGIGEPGLRRRRPPGQTDVEVQPPGRMIGKGRVALDTPIASRLAGRGIDGEHLPVAAEARLGEFPGRRRDRQVPLQLPALEPQRPGEFEEAIEYMLSLHRLDPVIGEEPLPISRSRLVVAQPDRRLDEEARQACAQGHLHVQQDVEAPTGESPPVISERPEPPALVKNDELDPFDIPHQRGFQLTDDPGNPRPGPVFPDGPHHRHHVGAVPDGRKPEDTNGFGWLSQRE